MEIRKISILCVFFVIIALCSCSYIKKESENSQKSKTDISKAMEEIYEKGYDLPIKGEDEEAEKDCVAVMENYLVVEKFLHNSEQGIEGEAILYDILWDGSIEKKIHL